MVQEILDSVFKQNHFNAKFFEVAIISAFIFLGVFQNYKIVVIPAAASILLVFTLFLMFISFSVFIAIFIILSSLLKFCINLNLTHFKSWDSVETLYFI